MGTWKDAKNFPPRRSRRLSAPVRRGAGSLAVVAADALVRVDDEHVARVGQPLVEDEVEHRADSPVVRRADRGDAALFDHAHDRVARPLIRRDEREEIALFDRDGLAAHRGGDGRRAEVGVPEERHLAHVVARGHVGARDVDALGILEGDLRGPLADDVHHVTGVALADEDVALVERLGLRGPGELLEERGIDVGEDRRLEQAEHERLVQAALDALDRADELEHLRCAASRAAGSPRCATTVADRRRPESRPISPKNAPASSV